MRINGIDSSGLEDLYDLSFLRNTSHTRSKKQSKETVKDQLSSVENVKKVKSGNNSLKDLQTKESRVTSMTTSKYSLLKSKDNSLPKGKHKLDTVSRDIIRSIHGCVIRNNLFKTCRGAVLVRRRGHAWIEGNEMSGVGLSHGIRCISSAKVVALFNRIHNCETSGIFFRESSNGLVAGNVIYENKEAGVDIRSGSNPVLQHNQIHSGKRSGVVILDRGRGLIRDNDIFDNAEAGVYILYRGNPVVKNNRIWSGQAAGVAVTEEGRGQICHNDICGMEWGGIDIRNGGNPVVSNNYIRDGQADGIVIGVGGKGIIMDNDIIGNSGCGVWLLTISKPVIYNNRIGESGDCGISFVSNSDIVHENQQLSSQFSQQEQDQEHLLQPFFYDEDVTSSANFDDHDHTQDITGPKPDKNFATVDNNVIFENSGHGIHFCANEGLLIRENCIHSNQGCGVSITKPADITIQDNMICDNEGSGIILDTSSSASIHGNGIYGNQKHGLHISGKGGVRENDVFLNSLSGIQICGPGDPFVARNRVQSAKHHGISIMENARGFVEWNDIFEAKVSALYKHPESTTHIYNNNVVSIKLSESRPFCTYDIKTMECKLDESVTLEENAPPLRPATNKTNEKHKLRLGNAAGQTRIVSLYAGCHGRTRFCVIS
ncbi:F-box only protein 10 [Exaiptasia diaphana]|nr:F-box only protein 10 [Exaiptasia diaphana]